MRREQFLELQAREFTEAQLQSKVLNLARALGWDLRYHTTISIRSVRGFPDLVLVHTTAQRVLWVELKTERGRLTTEQESWLEGLRAAGQDVRLWRPAQLLSGEIEKELKGGQ